MDGKSGAGLAGLKEPEKKSGVFQWWNRWTGLGNPGRFEEFNMMARSVLSPELFSGAKLEFNKPLSPGFSITHAIGMGAADEPASYNFGAQYVSPRAMLISRIDTSGNMTGRWIHSWSPRVTSRSSAMVSPTPQQSQMDTSVDYTGTDFTATFKYSAPGDVMGAQYLQSVTQGLAVGADIVVVPNMLTGVSGAARYTGRNFIAAGVLSSMGHTTASYLHVISPKVSLAAEFGFNFNTHESAALIGYNYELRQASFKGHIDSTGRVAGLLEQKLNLGVKFVLSGEIDHSRQAYKFGFGLIIGQ